MAQYDGECEVFLVGGDVENRILVQRGFAQERGELLPLLLIAIPKIGLSWIKSLHKMLLLFMDQKKKV